MSHRYITSPSLGILHGSIALWVTIHGRSQPWLTLTRHHGWTPESSARSRCCRAETTAEFRSWQFVLKASLGLLDTAYSTELPLVEALRVAMTQPDSAESRARSEKMYYILALTTADHAQVIVQQVEPGHGYEAYRRLVEAYDPATSMRGLSMLEGILIAKFTSKSYLAQLQDWRLRVTRYEQTMGRALDDDVKVSVLLRNAPEAIRRQLQLNAEREGYTFEALYRHITGYMQLQTKLQRRRAFGRWFSRYRGARRCHGRGWRDRWQR